MSKKTDIGGSSGFNIYDLSYLKADRVNSGGGVNLQDPQKAEIKVINNGGGYNLDLKND